MYPVYVYFLNAFLSLNLEFSIGNYLIKYLKLDLCAHSEL